MRVEICAAPPRASRATLSTYSTRCQRRLTVQSTYLPASSVRLSIWNGAQNGRQSGNGRHLKHVSTVSAAAEKRTVAEKRSIPCWRGAEMMRRAFLRDVGKPFARRYLCASRGRYNFTCAVFPRCGWVKRSPRENRWTCISNFYQHPIRHQGHTS